MCIRDRKWCYGESLDWPNCVWWPDLWDDELHENTEPDIPFIKAQWRFNMSYAAWTKFRTVTLYGVTDFIHDEAQKADDVDMEAPPAWAGTSNRLSNEVSWLVFNMTFLAWPDIPRALGATTWTHSEPIYAWQPEVCGGNGFCTRTVGEAIYNVTHYNWTIIGRDAMTSDVVGAATLTSALDNYMCLTMGGWIVDSRLVTGDFLAALDMEDSNNPYIPWVCSRRGAGYLKSDFYYPADTAAGEEVGTRIGLRTRDAVWKQSICGGWIGTNYYEATNVTVVGGPYANLVGEYLNDMTPAFAIDEPPFNHEWTEIMALTSFRAPCKTYVDTETGNRWGYAVVATAWDLNGTAFLWVWGWTAEDTVTMCQILRFDSELANPVFWSQLPNGTTAVVVKIDYIKGVYYFEDILSPISAVWPYRLEQVFKWYGPHKMNP